MALENAIEKLSAAIDALSAQLASATTPDKTTVGKSPGRPRTKVEKTASVDPGPSGISLEDLRELCASWMEVEDEDERKARKGALARKLKELKAQRVPDLTPEQRPVLEAFVKASIAEVANAVEDDAAGEDAGLL